MKKTIWFYTFWFSGFIDFWTLRHLFMYVKCKKLLNYSISTWVSMILSTYLVLRWFKAKSNYKSNQLHFYLCNCTCIQVQFLESQVFVKVISYIFEQVIFMVFKYFLRTVTVLVIRYIFWVLCNSLALSKSTSNTQAVQISTATYSLISGETLERAPYFWALWLS